MGLRGEDAQQRQSRLGGPGLQDFCLSLPGAPFAAFAGEPHRPLLLRALTSLPNLYQWQRMKPHHYIVSGQTTLLAQVGVSQETWAANKLVCPLPRRRRPSCSREMMAKIEDKNEVPE